MWIICCPACGATLAPPGESAIQACWNCGWKSGGSARGHGYGHLAERQIKPILDAIRARL